MATVVEWGFRSHVEAHEGAMGLDSGAESSWQVNTTYALESAPSEPAGTGGALSRGKTMKHLEARG